MKYLSIVSILAVVATVTGQGNSGNTPPAPAPQVGAATAKPISGPTIPAGENPKVTATPISQIGTVGPTTQVLVQVFGETFSPKPTPVPEPTDPPSGVKGTHRPPVVVTLTGVAAAAAVAL